MSTELQKYSLANQSAAIREYADANGFEVVRSFEDAGVSGVTTKKRVGLATMLSEIVSGSADFEAVLVLDMTRWGRYQEPDESAHYDFMCRQAGVPIHYCGENFGNDVSSPIMKQIKRVMAGEYSRELSVKVRRGKRRMAEAGFAQGGGCPYGLQRREYTADGHPGRPLERGQRKSNPGYTVRFEKGVPEEVSTVLQIFRYYVRERLDAGLIASRLNREGSTWHDGSSWTNERVRKILICDLLIGVLAYAKTVRVLGHDAVEIPRTQWKFASAGEPVVPLALFNAAQRRRASLLGSCGRTDGELLDDLRRVLAAKGKLSRPIILADPACAHASVYAERFGGFLGAYARIGYQKPSRSKGLDPNGLTLDRAGIIRELRLLEQSGRRVSSDAIEAEPAIPTVWEIRKIFGSLTQAYVESGVAHRRAPTRKLG
tara:strand:+ start:1514 stop:2803 length:1290 start_codon:yes stop_codon:yes gene_type:complete